MHQVLNRMVFFKKQKCRSTLKMTLRCKNVFREIAALPTLFCAVSCLCIVYQTVIRERLTERVARNLSIIITTGIIIVIGLAIALIPATSLQVDRWSATTTFWDSIFQGIYPYGVKTYGSTNNYPSPFPVWQYFNLPFWAIGDVGWQQAFFLLVFIGAVFYYSRSWVTVLTVLLFVTL